MELWRETSWQEIFNQVLTVTYRTGTYESGEYTYSPLSPIEINCFSPVVSIKTNSVRAVSPKWNVAGWVELSYDLFNAPHRHTDRKVFLLNRGVLLTYPDLDMPIPFKLRLTFPYWIELLQLQIYNYIDQSGNYFPDNPDLEEVEDKLKGQNIVLSNASYAPNNEDPTLIDSIFIETVKYEQYRVGRFREVRTGRFLPDPFISTAPYQLTCIFTGTAAVPSGVIVVNVGG